MRETETPVNYAGPEDATGHSAAYVVVVGNLTDAVSRAGAWASGEVLSGITAGQLDTQINVEGETEPRQYAIFQIDPTTQKAVAVPDIAKYGIMNVSAVRNKAVLRKIDASNHSSLSGAQFQILRYDRTLVSSTDINGVVTTTFTSGENGVFFVDWLPYGIYYIHETTVPSEYRTLSDGTNWYTVTVDDNGVSEPQSLTTAP